MNVNLSKSPTMKKKHLLLVSLILWALSSWGVTVQIGSGTTTTSYFPIYTYYGYNYSQQIYLGSEISGGGGGVGSISKIRFYCNSAQTPFANWSNWTVYLKNTTKTSFTSNTDWVAVGTMTQVFSGNIPTPVSGAWLELTLTTPFEYDGTNLVVAVDENSSSYTGSATSWRSFASGSNRGILYYSDGTNPNPASPPTANYGPNASLAQIQLEISLAPVCSGMPDASTINGANAVCYNTGTTLSLSSSYSLAGITYQWKSSTVAGGPYTNLGTASTQATGNLTETTYYICEISCSYSGKMTITPEKSVTVNPLPAITATPPSAPYCSPGGTGVAITADGAGPSGTYSWNPTGGLNPATGPNVVATPATTTTYTVTGTDNNGCSNTATSVITVTATPTVSASASPTGVCLNGSSQLQAFAATPSPVKNYTFTANPGTSLDPMTGATQAIGAGDDDTPTATPAAIGFPFTFDGMNYTQYSVSPDGWLMLGGTLASSQYTNSITSATNIPKIYPYWDDMATGADGNVKTLVTGSAPNRIFIVQWFVTIPRATSGAANSTFQAWLYEAGGKIEFRYGAMGSGTMSASVGLTGNTPASDFQSITLASGTSSTTSPNDNNTGQPASGTLYTFTLPVPPLTWSPGTFLNSTIIPNPLASNMTTTTTYTVTADNSGCTSQAGVTVTVGTELTATATADPAGPVCSGTAVLLTGTPTGGGGPYQYSWKANGTEVSTAQSFTVNPAETTTYDLMITDNCTQTASASVTMTVKPVPTAGASSNSPLCDGGVLNLTGSTDIGDTFAWTGPNGFSSSLLTPTLNPAMLADAGTYTFTASLNGCTSAPATTGVVIHPAPAAVTITPSPAVVPSGGTQSLTASGGNITKVLLSEDFNGTVPGWFTINNSTGGTPANAAWALYNSSPGFQSNDNSVFVLSNSDAQGSGGTTRTQLISPTFNTTGCTSLTLSFWHFFRLYTSADHGYVEVSTDGGATWVAPALADYNATIGSATAWVNAVLDLSAYVNQPNMKIRFNYYAEYGWYWEIDNVVISGIFPTVFSWSPLDELFTNPEATIPYTGAGNVATVYVKPTDSRIYTATATSDMGCTQQQSAEVISCPAVPGFVASFQPTPTSFSLVWFSSGGNDPESYTIEVATDEQFLNPVAGSPFTVYPPILMLTVNGLDGSTQYYYHVRANVTGCSSGYTEPDSITTLCPATPAPFTEGFEGTTFVPDCWGNRAVTGIHLWERTTGASGQGIGTASAFANFFNQSSGSYEMTTMPFDAIEMYEPVLKFNYAYATYVVENDELDIYYSTDFGFSWDLLEALPGGVSGPLNTAGATTDPFVPTAAQWATREIALPAGTNMLKFKAISAYGNNLYLDNIEVTSDIPVTTIVGNTVIGSGQSECYSASGTVVVGGSPDTFVVNAGGSATLVAGHRVFIRDGARVMPGGYLHAYIGDAWPFCGAKAPALPGVAAGTGVLPEGFPDARFVIFPNPTSGNVTFELRGALPGSGVRIEVFSMQGARVASAQMTGGRSQELSVAGLPDGLYFVKIVSGDHTETVKLVKTR